jgi:dihydroflavonol-4-reductase
MIFVTGGTGFLGRHLIPALCRAGYALRVLTRHPENHSWLQRYPDVEIIQGDLRTGDGLEAIVGCDYIVHAAGLFSMWSLAGDFEATNVTGTERLLEQAVEAGVKRLIYVSTVAVIGNPQPGCIIDETHPPRPADEYQASKLRAERLIQTFYEQTSLETLILRPGAFYGPMGDYAFNRLFFVDPMRGIIMQMDGGKYTIFPVYVGDVAQSIVSALHRGRSGETYNICGECLMHREAFALVRKEAGFHWPPLWIPGSVGIGFARLLTWLSRITQREPFWPLNLRSYVFNDWHVSSEKARCELGFEPLPFAEGVRRTVAWYKANQPDMLPELDC